MSHILVLSSCWPRVDVMPSIGSVNRWEKGLMSGLAPAIISGAVALVVAGAGIAVTALSQRNEYTRKIAEEKERREKELELQAWRLRAELENSLKLQGERIRMERRTVFMAEEAIRDLLMQESYRRGRRFDTIKRAVGGWITTKMNYGGFWSGVEQ